MGIGEKKAGGFRMATTMAKAGFPAAKGGFDQLVAVSNARRTERKAPAPTGALPPATFPSPQQPTPPAPPPVQQQAPIVPPPPVVPNHPVELPTPPPPVPTKPTPQRKQRPRNYSRKDKSLGLLCGRLLRVCSLSPN